MIIKFKEIKNIAVFKDFSWDKEVQNEDGEILTLLKTNILYGRNYSGKTTLSRIMRSLEKGSISDKFESPECCLVIEDEPNVTQLDFTAHSKTIRVFNEDFTKENLKFITDPDENVNPFAILGGDNNVIEEKIEELRIKLGSNEEGSESGLYNEFKTSNAVFVAANSLHNKAVENLDLLLNDKAIGRQNGIKYNAEKFGDQNYTNSKLRGEIELVRKNTFVPLTEEQKQLSGKIIKEASKEEIPTLVEFDFELDPLLTSAKVLIEKPIGKSDKIEKLVKNAVLNRWVKEGRELHNKERGECSFCGNEISDTRWTELDKHFDEESELLEKEIEAKITEVINLKESIEAYEIPDKTKFYAKYEDNHQKLEGTINTNLKTYLGHLDNIKDHLENRKKNILNASQFEDINLDISPLTKAIEDFDNLITESNKYTEKLSNDQNTAKKNLRLTEIYEFLTNIKYEETILEIQNLKNSLKETKLNKEKKATELELILKEIEDYKKELKDETKGADTVNELLNNYFGHSFLSLKAIEYDDELGEGKKYRFEIQRDGKKAYHLSDGEKSLIAFCYFMARLQDVDTKGKKPIIWIDDPISSLDSNHIFFIYSLINTQIYGEDDFEQLFISTHNLNFLKYLKRLPKAHNDDQRAERNKLYRHLVIERNDKESTIKLMPNYLKEYVSEFNYLFKQIYTCSQMENVDDQTYTAFYNFGNNARKFLELFLFYKYPDSTVPLDKMKKFFGDENIPAVLTDRLNNEYSHLSGIFERGESVVEVPEMNKAAKLIIETIKEKDSEQFEALLKSIGKTELAV